MVDFADPLTRPPSRFPCIYWDGTRCIATQFFGEDDITCFNDGNCDGFGTCRGCSKYDQGGLKYDGEDGQGGYSQRPFNLQIYNLRAQIQPCCHWEGSSGEFTKDFVRTNISVGVESISAPAGVDINSANGQLIIAGLAQNFPDGFPGQNGRLVAIKEGTDEFGESFPRINIRYQVREENIFRGCTTFPANELDFHYVLYLAERKGLPIWRPQGVTINGELGEATTKCNLAEAAPWQEGLTEENPSSYGCNGAKPECPFYTGAKFTEVVDAKMDTGDRITAKQIMELRYYSNDWKSMPNPREVWEQTFKEPDIWAWARKLPIESGDRLLPGPGRIDPATSLPLLQKVTIETFTTDTPIIRVGAPVIPSTGTPVVAGPPDYPTLIKEISDLSSGLKVLFPQNTTISSPFVKKIFRHEDRFFYISALINMDREAFAVNLTKHPQGELSNEFYLKQLRQNNPEDIYRPFVSGLPGETFQIELTTEGLRSKVNHIRIFVDTGLGELDAPDETATPGSFNPSYLVDEPALPTGERRFLVADLFVELQFYHAHVAQKTFNDLYGHTMVDPWVNHFTRFDLTGKVINLTGNTALGQVLWNTISSEGKKSMYAIEEQIEITSDSDEIEWEVLGCNYILVKFLSPKVNRVAPWRAWGEDSKGAGLFVKVDRSENSDIGEGELEEVELELAFATTNGLILPGNMAIFRTFGNEAVRPFNPRLDKLFVRYAYTEYRQAPIVPSDVTKLKFGADIDAVTDIFPYEVTLGQDNTFTIDGTFVKAGDVKLYSCDDIIGDCYTKTAFENEKQARTVFFNGGIEEDTVKTIPDMVTECKERFEADYSGKLFPDGAPVNFIEAVTRMQNLHLKEGSQHYLFIFNDEDGRPIGAKNTAFLTQSAVAQARDVEIRYKWGAQMQHYPNRDGMSLLAQFFEPLYSTTDRLRRLVQEYDPFCGDHAETDVGNNGFRDFSLGIDKHGPLWYPYKSCLVPSYHSDSSIFTNVVSYLDIVEGFNEEPNKRRSYWERMRAWDKYMPAIMDFIQQLGCFWSERTTVLNANPPYVFFGYSKIRSSHAFGPWATDRESLRVSRHWEKKNLSVSEEVISQDPDGGYTIKLADAFEEALYDADGNLKEGQDLQTPVWVHMNDGFSLVSPTSEDVVNPFGRYLLSRVGDHEFEEVYDASEENRFEMRDVFEERDYTSTLDRNEDGSVIYLADGTALNVEGGLTLEENKGNDIRWVFKPSAQPENVWAWLAEPDDPIRGFGSPRIGGIIVKNPNQLYFKKSLVPATHAIEGEHTITYDPHVFDDDGEITESAALALDSGPKLYISQTTSNLFVLAGTAYDPVMHEGEDYTFLLTGEGPGGIGILADARGLQRFEVNGQKFATYAGVQISNDVVIDELPYSITDIRFLGRAILIPQVEKLDNISKEYSGSEIQAVRTGMVDFKGHYYVENIELEFIYGDDADIPTVTADGILFETLQRTILFPTTSYVNGASAPLGTSRKITIPIGVRLLGMDIQFGVRAQGRKFNLEKVTINMRNNVRTIEKIKVFSPKVNTSRGNTGTHHPASLEFYFQRSFPDFAKDYVSGQLSAGDLGAFDGGLSITPLPGTEVKYSGRRVKDILPHFEFSDPVNNRFPYNNIDITAIPGYSTESAHLGEVRFIGQAVRASSKGWTLYTTDHQSDPGADLTHPNTFNGVRPVEELQEELYANAGELLGDKAAVFNNFWHPKEIELFSKYGVSLESHVWSLVLRSTVAPINRVFQHDDYGCSANTTTEYVDGFIHKLENWQARGVFHYQCDPKFNWTCFDTVMNKCNTFLFEEYGTEKYLDNDVINRFTYVFSFPPRDYGSYISAGLIDKNYQGGRFGGISSSAVFTAASLSGRIPLMSFGNPYFSPTALPPKGPGPFR